MNYAELEIYCKKIFNDYLNKYNLSVEDKKDVIQNTLLKLFLKEQDGTLTGDIETNKNYIFITLRNYVFQQGTSKYKQHITIDGWDLPSQDDNILDLMDFQQRKDIVLNLMKNKRFKQIEIDVVNDMFLGHTAKSLEEKYGLTNIQINTLMTNAKNKLKLRMNYYNRCKYKLTYNSGKVVFFLNKKELLQHTKISPDSWSNYQKIGKTIFPKYKIEML